MKREEHCTPGDNADARIIQTLVEIWNAIRLREDPGETTWEVLDTYEREVTDCLAMQPPDLRRAMSVTLEAVDVIGRGDI